MSRRKKKNSAGRAVIVVLCILLIGACAVLMFKDQKRDFRHGVYRCKDGRLMEEPAVPDQEIIDGVREGTELLAKAHPEIRQYMMLVPSAACIQSEYLPENAGKVRDQAQDLAQIQSVLQQNLEWVDLISLFNDHKGEKLFYATAPYLTGEAFLRHCALSDRMGQPVCGEGCCRRDGSGVFQIQGNLLPAL